MQLLACLKSSPRLTVFAAGLVYALGMVLAFPPFDCWPLVFVCCVPLFWVISTSILKPRTLALFAAMGVLPFWLYEEFWISRITGAGYIPMCLLLVLYAFAQVYLTTVVMRWRQLKYCAIPAAVVWCGINVLRGEVIADGYPWYIEGHPLASAGILANFGAIVGAYGVTFVVLVVNGLIADGARLRRPLMAGSAVLTIAVMVAGAFSNLVTYKSNLVSIACVQTNVAQEIKMGGGIASQVEELKVLEELTRKAAVARPDMIVWPETMKPGLSLDAASLQTEREAGLFFRYKDANGTEQRISSTKFADDLLKMQKEIGVPLIVGEEAFEGLRFPADAQGVRIEYDRRYNSAFVVKDGTVQAEQYNKLHLTPFGEYMPYIRAWPWLQKQLLAFGANGMSFDLAEGKQPVQLSVSVPVKDTSGKNADTKREIMIGTPICFEIADAATVRKLARGADVLVTLTNDGWFGESDRTREQHVQLARWRAIETGLPVVRCANTGISCAIARNGEFIEAEAGFEAPTAREAGVLLVRLLIPVGSAETVYMKGGWVTPWVILAGMFSLFVWGLFGNRQAIGVK